MKLAHPNVSRVDREEASNALCRRRVTFTQWLYKYRRQRWLMVLFSASLLASVVSVADVTTAMYWAASAPAPAHHQHVTSSASTTTVHAGRGAVVVMTEPQSNVAFSYRDRPLKLRAPAVEKTHAPAVYATDWQGDFQPPQAESPTRNTQAQKLAKLTPPLPTEPKSKAVPNPLEDLVSRIAHPKRPAWQRYAARAYPRVNDGRPQISVVIDDIGLNRERTLKVLALPRPLTLAFLPYGQPVSGLVTRARAVGHEVILHLPMEPSASQEDPGPNALYTNLSETDLNARIEWAFSQFSGFVGISNHMGSRFTQNTSAMSVVMRRLQRTGLLFLDSVTSQFSKGYQLARAHQIPAARRDVFLDHDAAPAAIRVQLANVERIAQEKGQAIAIGHPYNSTLSLLGPWLESLSDRGFNLVPISAMIQMASRQFAAPNHQRKPPKLIRIATPAALEATIQTPF